MKESILITGANTGVGKEATGKLALKADTKKVMLHGTKTHRYKTALPP